MIAFVLVASFVEMMGIVYWVVVVINRRRDEEERKRVLARREALESILGRVAKKQQDELLELWRARHQRSPGGNKE
jgi:hypothetical protein